VVVGDFKTPLSTMDRSSTQKNQQRNLRTKLNDTINQVDISDVYRISNPTTTQKHFSQQPMEISPK
jgi:hypothetical protein